MRKAQGISINVIIVAAIALLVLVVLSVIFLGKIGNVAGDDCSKYDNTICQAPPCDSGYARSLSLKCYVGGQPDDSSVCCQKIG